MRTGRGRFEAAAGTVVRLEELAPPCGNGFVWDLFDEDGAALFEGDDLQVCGNVSEKVVALERGGTYTIHVRAKFDQAATGPYSFALLREEP